jgi:hypothetical protein
VDHARRNLSIGGGMSATTHGLAALLLSSLPTAQPPIEPVRVENVMLVIEPTSTPTLIEPRTTFGPSPPAPHRARAATTTVRPPMGPVAIEPDVTPSMQPEPDARPRPLPSLDPRHVALRAIIDERGPSMPGPPATIEAPGDAPTPIDEAFTSVERWIAREANASPFDEPEPPHLTPHPDGTLTWTGPHFTATIEPDGTVCFSDRPGATYDWTRGEGTIDPERWLMELAGQDPFASQHMEFMEQTADVRQRLEDERRRRDAERAIRRLRGELAGLWQDERRSARERRRAIFERWDGAADDASGREAREAVLVFVRETLPATSPDAYGAMELATLNAERVSAERFAPY